MNIIKPRAFYKPFDFPWAFDLYKKHEALHWMPEDVALHGDVRDWNEKLTAGEKELLTHLFRFFTQSDIDVASGYHRKFIPYFAGTPELAMMMGSFANREAIHINAYSVLLETLGMPEITYQQFQDYKEMREKHDFVERFGMSSPNNILKSLAVYSAFTEGMQLFSSFVVLLNFSRFNKMKAMGNIIAWSIRDESMHVDGMTRLFQEVLKIRYPDGDYDFIQQAIIPIAYKMVELEDAFIDLMFKDKEIEGLTADQVKQYIRYIANQRMEQLGFNTHIYTITKNPLPWVDYMVNGEEHTNFFEQKSTSYSKGMTQGSIEDIKW